MTCYFAQHSPALLAYSNLQLAHIGVSASCANECRGHPVHMSECNLVQMCEGVLFGTSSSTSSTQPNKKGQGAPQEKRGDLKKTWFHGEHEQGRSAQATVPAGPAPSGAGQGARQVRRGNCTREEDSAFEQGGKTVKRPHSHMATQVPAIHESCAARPPTCACLPIAYHL
eukprot:1161063-Pelagomonas_calceolata.AAC.6